MESMSVTCDLDLSLLPSLTPLLLATTCLLESLQKTETFKLRFTARLFYT